MTFTDECTGNGGTVRQWEWDRAGRWPGAEHEPRKIVSAQLVLNNTILYILCLFFILVVILLRQFAF